MTKYCKDSQYFAKQKTSNVTFFSTQNINWINDININSIFNYINDIEQLCQKPDDLFVYSQLTTGGQPSPPLNIFVLVENILFEYLGHHWLLMKEKSLYKSMFPILNYQYMQRIQYEWNYND